MKMSVINQQVCVWGVILPKGQQGYPPTDGEDSLKSEIHLTILGLQKVGVTLYV